LAWLIFFGSYIVFALGKFPGMKIDRPGAAIIGAVLMVAFRIVGAQQALGSIDFATIVLLFSMMLITGNLGLAGFFDWITEWIIARLHPHHLLPTVIFTCGTLSAFLVNDIVCLVMDADGRADDAPARLGRACQRQRCTRAPIIR
jgi:Na+/H+ antiporter NhaD/arsenite permease-like protein